MVISIFYRVRWFGRVLFAAGGSQRFEGLADAGALLGADGLVWAQPVADVLSLVLVAALLAVQMRRDLLPADAVQNA